MVIKTGDGFRAYSIVMSCCRHNSADSLNSLFSFLLRRLLSLAAQLLRNIFFAQKSGACSSTFVGVVLLLFNSQFISIRLTCS